jgi:hypothetical protein
MTSPLGLIPASSDGTPIGPKLADRLEREVFAPARSIGADVPLVAVTDPLPPVEIRRSSRGTWWVASTFEANPVVLANGGVTKAPPPVIEELRALRAAGIDFDYIYVLDELPGTWIPGTPPPAMQPLRNDSAAGVVRTQESIFAAGLAGLRAATKVAASAGRGGITVGAVAGAALAGAIAYDPLILGGVTDPDSGRIAWFTLAAWDEELQ